MFLFRFERIETVHQSVELIDPVCGNKIIKIQKQLSRLSVANERHVGWWIF